MVRGVIQNNRPIINLVVAGINSQNVQNLPVLVDTGFTGDLKVSPVTARNLNLVPIGVEYVVVGHGRSVPMTTSVAWSVLDGRVNLVNVLIADGVEAIGVGFLRRFAFNLTVNTPLNLFTIW